MNHKYIARENPHLYEINTAAWLFELSQKLGKPVLLRDVPGAEWDRLKAWGMDFVWLMGVWNRSEEGRKLNINTPDFRAFFETVLPACADEDILGSCYAISSYGPDPLIGTWEDLDHARAELHKRKMGLILDFVPNHTGMDHHWLTEHPEYYIQGSRADYEKDPDSFFTIDYEGQTLYIAHGRDPNFPSWTDTAQLNYFNPETRKAMLQRIEEIAQHCDGIRCDMAMLELNPVFQRIWDWANKNPGYSMPSEEFWTQVTGTLPGLVYIAEAYWDTEYTLQQLGFDFVYDKRLYDRMRYNTPHEVYMHLKADMGYQKKLMRFIENHDEPRSITAFGKDKVEAAAVLFSGLPGLKLFFHGQYEGKRIRLPIQIRQTRPENVNTEILSFYNKLLSAINVDIFHSGVWRLKETLPVGNESSENLIAYTWKLGEALRLVIVNLSPQPAQGRVCFQDDVNELHSYLIQNKLNGKAFTVTGKLMAHPGLIMDLAGYQAQLLEIEFQESGKLPSTKKPNPGSDIKKLKT